MEVLGYAFEAALDEGGVDVEQPRQLRALWSRSTASTFPLELISILGRLGYRDLEEALDHRGDLVRYFELMEVAGADGHADVEIGLEREQPCSSLSSSGGERRSSSGTSQRASAATPFQAAMPRITAAATLNGTAHIVSTIDCRSPGPAVVPTVGLDPGAAHGFASGAVELRREPFEDRDGLGERVDRSGIDGNNGLWNRWVPGCELDRDHPSQAVTEHDGPRDSDLRAEPGDVVGEARYVVSLLGAATAAAAA